MHGNVDTDLQTNKQILSSRQIIKSTQMNWQTKRYIPEKENTGWQTYIKGTKHSEEDEHK